ncbi:MAG: TetR/AcrR family transcriptional regulator [Deltaproteobacteria bacterium]|nr:TetR/AcrR family transcriptional regulator [Deltaproteobacteria bacterium]
MKRSEATAEAPPQSVSRLDEKRADKTQRIVTAGLTLFAERGFHGTSIPDICKEANVAAGTIYRYFESKEALVNAVFRASKARLRDCLFDGLDTKAAPRSLFRDFFWRLVAFARSCPTDFAFLEMQDHIPYLDRESRDLEIAVLAPIWLVLLEHRNNGVMKEVRPEIVIGMVWGALVGLMKGERMGYFKVTEQDLVDAEQACWDGMIRRAGGTN